MLKNGIIELVVMQPCSQGEKSRFYVEILIFQRNFWLLAQPKRKVYTIVAKTL